MTTMGSCSNTWTARFPQVATNPPLNDTRALISFPALTCTEGLEPSTLLSLWSSQVFSITTGIVLYDQIWTTQGRWSLFQHRPDSLQFFSDLIQAPFYESLLNSLMSSISAGAVIWSYDQTLHGRWWYMIKPCIWSHPIYDPTLDMIKSCTSFSSSPSLSSCLQINFEKKKMMVVDLK